MESRGAEISHVIGPALQASVELLAFTSFGDPTKDPLFKSVDAALGGVLADIARSESFEGKTGINRLTGYQLTDAMCGFRLFRVSSLRKILPVFDHMLEPQYLASEMFIRFAKAGLSVGEVPVRLRPRLHGASRKGLFRYGYGIIRAIILTLLDRNYRVYTR